GVPPPPSCPLLLLLLRPTLVVSSRSALRLPLAGAAALAGARRAGALVGVAGAVEVVVEAVEGVGVVVGVVAEVEVSAAAVGAAAAAVAEGAVAAVVAEAAEAVVELVAVLHRGVAPVVVSASSSSAVVRPLPPSSSVSAQVFHTFTLDSGASRSFFRDRTTLTPLSRPVAVSLADPSGGPVLASFSTVLPCPAAPSGSLSGLYLPSFSTNLVSGADLQDQGVD
ncbi:unnamed protein product, partial [Closterium sp. NIES-54]